MGFIIRGFIWDIPILLFAYVLFRGPNLGLQSSAKTFRFGVAVFLFEFHAVGLTEG